MDLDLEPALEALSLVHDSDAGRRLDLICLDVPDADVDDQVERKQIRTKKSRRKKLTSTSSPVQFNAHPASSLSLSEDFPVQSSNSNAESSASPKQEDLTSTTENADSQEVASSVPLFSEFFPWPQVSIEGDGVDNENLEPEEKALNSNEYDFSKAIRYVLIIGCEKSLINFSGWVTTLCFER